MALFTETDLASSVRHKQHLHGGQQINSQLSDHHVNSDSEPTHLYVEVRFDDCPCFLSHDPGQGLRNQPWQTRGAPTVFREGYQGELNVLGGREVARSIHHR